MATVLNAKERFFLYASCLVNITQSVIYTSKLICSGGENYEIISLIPAACPSSATMDSRFLPLIWIWSNLFILTCFNFSPMPRLCCFSTHYVDPDITRDHVLEVLEWSFGVLSWVLRIWYVFYCLTFTQLTIRHWSLPSPRPMGLSIFPGLHARAVVCCRDIFATSGPSINWMLCRSTGRPGVFKEDIQTETLLGIQWSCKFILWRAVWMT